MHTIAMCSACAWDSWHRLMIYSKIKSHKSTCCVRNKRPLCPLNSLNSLNSSRRRLFDVPNRVAVTVSQTTWMTVTDKHTDTHRDMQTYGHRQKSHKTETLSDGANRSEADQTLKPLKPVTLIKNFYCVYMDYGLAIGRTASCTLVISVDYDRCGL